MVTAVYAPSKTRSAPAPRFLIATVARLEIHSTQRKQTTKRKSNRNKNASSSISLPFALPFLRPLPSYPFAPCSHSFLKRSARVLPLEIAPRRLG
jgi:hypothetical protein